MTILSEDQEGREARVCLFCRTPRPDLANRHESECPAVVAVDDVEDAWPAIKREVLGEVAALVCGAGP